MLRGLSSTLAGKGYVNLRHACVSSCVCVCMHVCHVSVSACMCAMGVVVAGIGEVGLVRAR